MPYSDDPVRDWDEHNLECDKYDPREHDHCRCNSAGCPWCDPEGYGKEQGRILESALGEDVKEPLEWELPKGEPLVEVGIVNPGLPTGVLYDVEIFPEPIHVTEEDFE